MAILLRVYLIDHRGEGRGLAASGSSRDEDQPFRPFAQVLYYIERKTALLKSHYMQRKQPHCRPDVAPLDKAVDPETPQPLYTERDIKFELALKFFHMLRFKHAVSQPLRILGRKRGKFRGHQLFVYPKLGRGKDRKMQVRRAFLYHKFKQCLYLYVYHKSSLMSPCNYTLRRFRRNLLAVAGRINPAACVENFDEIFKRLGKGYNAFFLVILRDNRILPFRLGFAQGRSCFLYQIVRGHALYRILAYAPAYRNEVAGVALAACDTEDLDALFEHLGYRIRLFLVLFRQDHSE